MPRVSVRACHAIYNRTTVPVFYLFIAGLVYLTFLFPERVTSFLRTIQQWLAFRQTKREERSARLADIDDAMQDFVTRVAVTVRQLRIQPTDTRKRRLMVQLKAEAGRYLKTVNRDDQPPIHRFAQKLIRDIDKAMNNSAVRQDNR